MGLKWLTDGSHTSLQMGYKCVKNKSRIDHRFVTDRSHTWHESQMVSEGSRESRKELQIGQNFICFVKFFEIF